MRAGEIVLYAVVFRLVYYLAVFPCRKKYPLGKWKVKSASKGHQSNTTTTSSTTVKSFIAAGILLVVLDAAHCSTFHCPASEARQTPPSLPCASFVCPSPVPSLSTVVDTPPPTGSRRPLVPVLPAERRGGRGVDRRAHRRGGGADGADGAGAGVVPAVLHQGFPAVKRGEGASSVPRVFVRNPLKRCV